MRGQLRGGARWGPGGGTDSIGDQTEEVPDGADGSRDQMGQG